MKTPKYFIAIALSAILVIALTTPSCQRKPKEVVIELKQYGIIPNTAEDMSPLFNKAIDQIRTQCGPKTLLRLVMDAGQYDFYPESAVRKECFISNHDQVNPKKIGISLDTLQNVILDGSGAELLFHGRMMPLSMQHSQNIGIQNLSIDFQDVQIAQIQIVKNDSLKKEITFRPAPWVDYELRDGVFYVKGREWELTYSMGIAFEKTTRRLVYRSSDMGANVSQVSRLEDGLLLAKDWYQPRLIPGTVMALRSWERPNPGIFVNQSKDVTLSNIQVHYAEGMGLLAQVSENITLDRFSVCLRGDTDPRYFTTQADATHFSGCKGFIHSTNGLYENMMDDAINIHGTYLKIMERLDSKSVRARYMHSQSYGFLWGNVGDTVQFIRSNTMDLLQEQNTIAAITPLDKETISGAKEYKIVFRNELPAELLPSSEEAFGIENLSWTPGVLFADNIIRNNRARGALFSTPQPTIVERNLFDHTSGTAILLCGDCNGWYETGACRDVIIRNNLFVNALTSLFQFTNAVISIYPEIPDLENQKYYFHGSSASSIRIENNSFTTFDQPILYAKSVNGLVFKGNTINESTEYPPYHWNTERIKLERVINQVIDL